MKKFRSKTLTCGCCGSWFSTWPAYEDQDQDRGFGICLSCQRDRDAKNETEWLALEKKVAGSMNEKNRVRFKKMELGVRRGLILKMMDDGIIKWTIRGK